MFGCGKFEDITMLKYVEETVDEPTRADVDTHLLECDVCMNEITELNRVDAVMDAGEPERIQKANALTLFICKGIIQRFSHSSGKAELVPIPATRGETSAAEQKTAELSLDDPPARIQVIPVADGQFRISLECAGLSNDYVELKRAEDGSTVYLKKPDGNSLTIKGVAQGEYELFFAGTTVRLEMREEESDER